MYVSELEFYYFIQNKLIANNNIYSFNRYFVPKNDVKEFYKNYGEMQQRVGTTVSD